MSPLHMVLQALIRWIAGEQHKMIEYLRAENPVLKAPLRGRRVQLSDADRRRLALLGARLGRSMLTQIATIVTADTILRWHRDLLVRKGTNPKRRPGRPRVDAEIRGLVVRMATENPTWGYTRMQGALKNLGHRVARSTVANILKEQGILPSGKRPMSWRTFVGAHWGALCSGEFLTADVWTLRRWVKYYAGLLLELRSRRVRVMVSTPHPYEEAVPQVARQLADVVDVELAGPRVRICDRDRTWSTAVQYRLQFAGVRLIRAPVFAPNCDAHAQRFVSSIQEKCMIA